MAYVVRSESGLIFASCEDDDTYGEEIEYSSYEEALASLRVYENTFKDEEFYIEEVR